eukprot:g73114.t1
MTVPRKAVDNCASQNGEICTVATFPVFLQNSTNFCFCYINTSRSRPGHLSMHSSRLRELALKCSLIVALFAPFATDFPKMSSPPSSRTLASTISLSFPNLPTPPLPTTTVTSATLLIWKQDVRFFPLHAVTSIVAPPIAVIPQLVTDKNYICGFCAKFDVFCDVITPPTGSPLHTRGIGGAAPIITIVR